MQMESLRAKVRRLLLSHGYARIYEHSLLVAAQAVRLAEELFGVSDAAVLSAIGCHTTLKPGASRLDMALFVADKLAWDQPGAPPYREAVLKGLDASLEAGAYAYIGYLLDNRSALKVVHPWMEAAYQGARG